ncbi:MAG: hypothetical protein WBA12_08230 [Catalinimonas sp.]
MSFIDSLMQRLFPAPKHAHDTPRLVREVLRRGDSFRQEWADWRTTDDARALIDRTQRAYYFKRRQIESEPDVHLLDSPYANGFALTYDPSFGERPFTFLLEEFRARTLAAGYRQANATHEIRDRGGYLETSERYYLKPPLQYEPQEKCDQLFGNVQQELIRIDDRPSYLKVVVSVYSDALYLNARPFDDYLDVLFAEQPAG